MKRTYFLSLLSWNGSLNTAHCLHFSAATDTEARAAVPGKIAEFLQAHPHLHEPHWRSMK